VKLARGLVDKRGADDRRECTIAQVARMLGVSPSVVIDGAGREVRRGRTNLQHLYRDYYSLTLWCQHPDCWHPWAAATYQISAPKDWLARISPYVGLIARTLQHAERVEDLRSEIMRVQDSLEMMKAMVYPDEPAGELGAANPGHPTGQVTAAEGDALRALRVIIFEHDRTRQFGGLRRVQAPSGDFLWVCPYHYAEYAPGLPALP
jgi:internalin A